MRDEYDFSGSRPNPYAERVRRPVTVNIDVETIDYFKEEARRTGISYQNIINMYLGECAAQRNGSRSSSAQSGRRGQRHRCLAAGP